MVRRRPLKIGLSARIFHPQPGAEGLQSKTLQYLEQTVADWVMARDVLVMMIPSINEDTTLHRSNIRLRDYADQLDGLVLQGGADISPQTYGEEPAKPEWHGDRVRDSYEMELLHEFVEARKPVLGICRGAQLINVAFGGTLYQDIASQLPEAQPHVTSRYDQYTHGVDLVPGSLLEKLCRNVKGRQTVSIHHQSVKALGRELQVEAWSDPDRVVEAIRWTGRGFVVGMQWHPEFHRPGDESVLDCSPILDEFLETARKTRW
jgi:putative glutamine amidotransferase